MPPLQGSSGERPEAEAHAPGYFMDKIRLGQRLAPIDQDDVLQPRSVEFLNGRVIPTQVETRDLYAQRINQRRERYLKSLQLQTSLASWIGYHSGYTHLLEF